MSTHTLTHEPSVAPIEPNRNGPLIERPVARYAMARSSLLVGLVVLLVVAIGFGMIMLSRANANAPRARRGGDALRSPGLTMLEPGHTTRRPALT